MASNVQVRETKNREAVLSTLWAFAVFNYLYADFFSMMFNSAAMKSVAAGMTQGVVMGWAVVMETAIAMILLSRLLNRRANRWANIAMGLLHTASVAWTLLGSMPPYYIFFATVEIVCTLSIVWYAWSWRPQAAPAVDR